jgi:hypothetical protein
MAECDERSWLAALSLMNSGMEADDGCSKTFVAVMCPNSRLYVQLESHPLEISKHYGVYRY